MYDREGCTFLDRLIQLKNTCTTFLHQLISINVSKKCSVISAQNASQKHHHEVSQNTINNGRNNWQWNMQLLLIFCEFNKSFKSWQVWQRLLEREVARAPCEVHAILHEIQISAWHRIYDTYLLYFGHIWTLLKQKAPSKTVIYCTVVIVSFAYMRLHSLYTSHNATLNWQYLHCPLEGSESMIVFLSAHCFKMF